jgi:hypothetical protein
MNLSRQVAAITAAITGIALLSAAPALAQNGLQDKQDLAAPASAGSKAGDAFRSRIAPAKFKSKTSFGQGMANASLQEAPKTTSQAK